jgi:antitoxin MazE
MCVLLEEAMSMVRNVRLRRMGGSVGATLPKDLADRFHMEAGDEVMAVETAQGILLTPYDADVEEALAIAAKAQKKYQGALRELAR